MQLTWYEQGLEKGRAQGLTEGRQENRKLVQNALEERFGQLSPEILHRLESWPADRLNELVRGVIRGQSLQELGLID